MKFSGIEIKVKKGKAIKTKMKSNYIPLAIFLIVVVFLGSGCQTTIKPKTIEELKEKKLTNPSEYDKCIREVEENQEKEEQCVRDKLKAKGFSDGIDCIGNFDNPDTPICSYIERYNAEVEAYNECLELRKQEPQLTIFDCMELIEFPSK